MNEMMHSEKLQRELSYMEQYRAAFEQRHPPPARQVATAQNWLIYVVLGGLIIASVIVSAYHTIPIFVGSELTYITFTVGLAVFVMVELGIVSLTYINIKKSYELNPEKHTDVLKWLQAGLALVFIVGLGVNVYSEVMKTGLTHPLVDLIIRILVGLSAPVMAFVSGEVLAMIGVDAQHQQRALDRQYSAEMVAYQDKFLAWWDARKARILASVTVSQEVTVRPQLSDSGQRTADNGHGNGHGYTRRTDARTTVLAHLEANPQDMSMSVRELADKLSVGKTTVADVLKERRQ